MARVKISEYSVENIVKSFGGAKALSNVSMSVSGGEVHCLAGENGSGKSTLIRCLNRLEEHQAGTIKVQGIEINNDLKNNDSIRSAWNSKGQTAFNKEKQDKTPLILKFENEPNSDIRDFIRSCGLHYNRFRHEWYGLVNNLKNLIIEPAKIILNTIEM